MRAILESFHKRFLLIVVMALFCVSLTASAAISPMEAATAVKPWVVLVILVWEYLVGKTKVVKSNSTIELVESFIKKMFGITSDDLKVG